MGLKDLWGLLRPSLINPSFNPKQRPSVLKRKCLTCSRWLNPSDIVASSCPYCLENKAENAIWKFRPLDNTKQSFPKCFECNQEIYLIGMKTWDVLGNCWKLLCTDCGEKQIQKDTQYRATPWGYAQKLR